MVMRFKATTFNLRLNVDSDKHNAWPYRVQAVKTFIEEEQPLIIGTQEVLDGMLDDLSKALPHYHHFGLTRRQHEEASAILYNHQQLEVKESGTFWLSKTPTIPNSSDFNSACIRVCS